MHFVGGEGVLSQWMAEHARVCWAVVEKPWTVESAAIDELDLPLNVQHNGDHPFVAELKRRRADQRSRARQLPVVG